MTAQNSVSDSEELRLLYQITAGDLAYFKTQQWSVTNYTLLLYAGVIGVAQMLKPSVTVVDRVVLVTVTIFVAMSALIILAKLQKSVRVRQSRLDAVRTKFTDAFQLAWSAEEKGVERFHAIYLLRIAVVVGAGVVCWLVGLRL
jgi:hypothetical protein